jgi:tRNA(fMet)-specific endonuclease VapC
VKYLLDTNICVYWLKGNEHIERKVLSVGIDNISISFINVSELYYGAYKSQRVDQNLAILRRLTERLNVVESDEAISEAFGSLKASLENAGMIIDDADIYIAACARVYGLTLVTNNTKHFRRLKGLKLDNWM